MDTGKLFRIGLVVGGIVGAFQLGKKSADVGKMVSVTKKDAKGKPVKVSEKDKGLGILNLPAVPGNIPWYLLVLFSIIIQFVFTCSGFGMMGGMGGMGGMGMGGMGGYGGY